MLVFFSFPLPPLSTFGTISIMLCLPDVKAMYNVIVIESSTSCVFRKSFAQIKAHIWLQIEESQSQLGAFYVIGM